MHIGIDARFLGVANTGLARYSENLLEALARKDTENHYTVYVNASLNWRLKLGPNFTLIPMRGRPNSLRGILRLSRAVRGESLDLLHVHFPLAPFFFDMPLLITVHDLHPFVFERNIFKFRLGLLRWIWTSVLYPRALFLAKWIVCVSHSTRDSLTNLFPSVFHKTIMIHSGITEAFRVPIEPATLDLIRARLELPDKYILYSGSIRADKNIEGLLKAFAELRGLNPDLGDFYLLLEISGEDPNLDPTYRLVNQLGLENRVRIIRNAGEEERRLLFEDARALVILSRHEGFGFPILEAQMCGLPVLAADAGALPEIAGENGALLVDPDRPEQVVAMLDRLLTDESLQAWLVAHGRTNAQRYDWNRVAEQMALIYRHLFYPKELVALPKRGYSLFSLR